MRPIRLELSGFTAFREPVEVDFDGADFFALVGPTGAGKSSIIDAITFALYGSVPRLGKRAVAPLISQGMLEARVRLDFSVGESTYTAVRVIRRTKTGTATTKEARLERADEVLAGDADSLTEEVERLLGLGFDEFTKCVVVPQGEFAKFLHDTPAARQDLLVRLLGLEVYGRMAQRANQIATDLEYRVELDRERLEKELSFATEEALAEAVRRLEAIDALAARIEREQPLLESLASDITAAEQEALGAERVLKLLGGVGVPDGADDLARRLAGAREAEGAALKESEDAGAAADEAAKALEGLPARAELELAVRAYQERAEAEAELKAERKALVSAETAERKGAKVVEAAQAKLADAQLTLERVRGEHRAIDLARTLKAGEPCPVCRRVVKTLPEAHEAAGLDAAEKAVHAAERARSKAEQGVRAAEGDRKAAAAAIAKVESRTAAIAGRLAAHPDPTAIERDLVALSKAEEAAGAARRAAAASRKTLASARTTLEDLRAAESKAWDDFGRARDALAALGPPPAGRDDLAAEWAALAGWARERAPEQESALAAARERMAEAEERRRSTLAELEDACAACGVEVEDGRVRDAVIAARENAHGAVERIRGAVAEAQAVRDRVEAALAESQVARTLGRYLGAREFEKWLLDEAVGGLIETATRILYDLSAGQYSLSLDTQGNFAVIDHRNADEPRSARTLSGGETFLASLALALALSEDIAAMAAEGARLEAIFLDEGFGTLDPDALATVGAAIENLAATGRMVGLVTHVRDIAEQCPVRLEVVKGPGGATVERRLA